MWFTDLRRPECNFLDLSRCATFGGNPTLLIVPTVKHDDCSIMLSNIFGLSVAFLTNVLITWSNFQTVSPRHSHGYAIFFPLKKKKGFKDAPQDDQSLGYLYPTLLDIFQVLCLRFVVMVYLVFMMLFVRSVL